MEKTPLLREGDVIELTERQLRNLGGPRVPGRYVVYKTTYDGGGTGHGPHDVFPDGHHVHCLLLADQSVRTNFYQTGCFNGMLRDVPAVGRATSGLWVEVSG